MKRLFVLMILGVFVCGMALAADQAAAPTPAPDKPACKCDAKSEKCVCPADKPCLCHKGPMGMRGMHGGPMMGDREMRGGPMGMRGMRGGMMEGRGQMGMRGFRGGFDRGECGMQGGPMMGGMHRGFGMGMMMLGRMLNLTPEQKAKMGDIMKSHADEMKAAFKPIMEKRKALMDAVMADKVDESAIRATSKELGDAIANAALLGAKVKGEMAAVLTPEQKKQVDEFKAKMEARRAEFKKQMEERAKEKAAPAGSEAK